MVFQYILATLLFSRLLESIWDFASGSWYEQMMQNSFLTMLVYVAKL